MNLLQSAVGYQQYFLQNMLHSICDKQPELRQASSYGIGVMAQFGGEGFGPAIQGRQIFSLFHFSDPTFANTTW